MASTLRSMVAVALLVAHKLAVALVVGVPLGIAAGLLPPARSVARVPAAATLRSE
jgi:ABC-type proline/glycine betaine transport system permease subunit